MGTHGQAPGSDTLHTSNDKKLIVNADDFGLTRRISDGIVEAHRSGIVTSTTLLVNMSATAYAVHLLSEAQSLGVGVHINLTQGVPISPPNKIPSLVCSEGRFLGSAEAVAQRPGFGTGDDLRREIDAQINAFLATGLSPTHLDSHQHLHRINNIQEVFMRVSQEMNVPTRRLENDLPQGYGLHPGRFIQDNYFHPDGKERILGHLSSIEAGTTELMCHPGFVDESPEERRLAIWVDERRREFDVLTDPAIVRAVGHFGIRLVTFKALHREA